MSHNRQADATLRGFYYQFLKTLEILLASATDEQIIVEGIVEDIDVIGNGMVQAIQCKYHESIDNFKLSAIYKPILQMLVHHSKNLDSNIHYILYIHIKGPLPLTISDEDIYKIMASSDKNLQQLICDLPNDLNVNKFLNQFRLEKGPSINELESNVKQKMSLLQGIDDAVDELYFPNAITYIGDLSRKSEEEDRTTSKSELVKFLAQTRSILYSKWALLTKSKQEIFKALRKQLSSSLGNNNRTRYFIIGEKYDSISNDLIDILFNYVDKYAFKPKIHTNEPMFFLDFTPQHYQNVIDRVGKYKTSNLCLCELGTSFNNELANKKSAYIKSENTRTFFYKLARLSDAAKEYIKNATYNDLFIIGSDYYPEAVNEGVQVYYLDIQTNSEVKYILGVRDLYE